MRTTGKVKWFDPVKGDGCVVSDGGTQAALARAALAAAGLRTIAPGTPLTYEVRLTAETLTVTAIYEIDGKPPPPATTGGRVKWFDQVKGYGFIVSDDVTGDVLVHHSVVKEFGNTLLAESAGIARNVTEHLRRLQPRRAHNPVEEPTGPWLDAECKWFSRPKGYGFVEVPGEPDAIFLHMDVMRRNNVRELTAGQRVQVRIGRTDRGLAATAIRLISAPPSSKPH